MLKKETIRKMLENKVKSGEIDDWGLDKWSYWNNVYYIEKDGITIFLGKSFVRFGGLNFTSIRNLSYYGARNWLNQAIKGIVTIKQYNIKYIDLGDLEQYVWHEKMEKEINLKSNEF